MLHLTPAQRRCDVHFVALNSLSQRPEHVYTRFKNTDGNNPVKATVKSPRIDAKLPMAVPSWARGTQAPPDRG